MPVAEGVKPAPPAACSAQQHQGDDVVSHAAGKGCGGERDDRAQEHAPAPVAVAEPAADGQHEDEAEGVGGNAPAGPVHAGVQILLQCMQGGGDDG